MKHTVGSTRGWKLVVVWGTCAWGWVGVAHALLPPNALDAAAHAQIDDLAQQHLHEPGFRTFARETGHLHGGLAPGIQASVHVFTPFAGELERRHRQARQAAGLSALPGSLVGDLAEGEWAVVLTVVTAAPLGVLEIDLCVDDSVDRFASVESRPPAADAAPLVADACPERPHASGIRPLRARSPVPVIPEHQVLQLAALQDSAGSSAPAALDPATEQMLATLGCVEFCYITSREFVFAMDELPLEQGRFERLAALRILGLVQAQGGEPAQDVRRDLLLDFSRID